MNFNSLKKLATGAGNDEAKDQPQQDYQEKAGQLIQGVTDKAIAAKDVVFETAQGAMDKLSGATQTTTKVAGDGATQTKETTGGFFDTAKTTAEGALGNITGATQVAKDKTVETTKTAGDTATETQKNVGGYLSSAKDTLFGSAPEPQKTPEAGGFLGAATGAGDALKGAFGFGGDSTTKK